MKPSLPPSESASHQAHTRLVHAEERSQDYVETIADLIENQGEARATDIARALGISHATVVRKLQRMQADGLVSSRPYRSVFLTDAGRKLAGRARVRHATVVAVLERMGVPRAAALRDAEGIEHHVSAETLRAFERYLAGGSPEAGPRNTRNTRKKP